MFGVNHRAKQKEKETKQNNHKKETKYFQRNDMIVAGRPV